MSELPADPPAYPWLSVERTLAWLQVRADDTELAPVAEDCRAAAGDYCEAQRPDLFAADGVTFNATPKVALAGILAAARLYARRSTPTGLASFGEFGASDILRLDPDVGRLLGTGRYAPPRVG